MAARARTLYATKIIKAGALLADTKTLLAYWDDTTDVSTNLARFRGENLFGKASRSRVEDILAIFRQRYLSEPGLLAALIIFARGGFAPASLDRILYVLALRADLLLQDAVLEVVAPVAASGRQELPVAEMAAWVRRQVAAGRTGQAWGEETIERVARGLMATLRDFGVLEGAQTKRIAYPHLPLLPFAFIALLLFRELGAGERLLTDPAWGVFFMTRDAVERGLVEAHQERLLEYHAAGAVVRLTFPTASLEEYAHDLAQRAH